MTIAFLSTTGAVNFITYLWHYLLARTVYDQMLRPLIHGHPWSTLFMGGVAIGGFAVGRWSGSRRPARPGERRRRRSP